MAENQEKLEGIPLGKAAETLARAASKFEKKLDEFLGGGGAGIQELEERLKSPQAKAHLPVSRSAKKAELI